LTPQRLGVVILAVLAAAGVAGCGESASDDRGATAVGLCRDHGGVVALEDEIVICRDQTAHTDE
jgi:hypothetical protein